MKKRYFKTIQGELYSQYITTLQSESQYFKAVKDLSKTDTIIYKGRLDPGEKKFLRSSTSENIDYHPNDLFYIIHKHNPDSNYNKAKLYLSKFTPDLKDTIKKNSFEETIKKFPSMELSRYNKIRENLMIINESQINKIESVSNSEKNIKTKLKVNVIRTRQNKSWDRKAIIEDFGKLTKQQIIDKWFKGYNSPKPNADYKAFSRFKLLAQEQGLYLKTEEQQDIPKVETPSQVVKKDKPLGKFKHNIAEVVEGFRTMDKQDVIAKWFPTFEVTCSNNDYCNFMRYKKIAEKQYGVVLNDSYKRTRLTKEPKKSVRKNNIQPSTQVLKQETVNTIESNIVVKGLKFGGLQIDEISGNKKEILDILKNLK